VRNVGRLVDAYREARSDGLPDVPADALAALEHTLSSLCARGRAAHPALNLDDCAFAAHLARCGADVAGDPAPARMRVEDLYLCCAALLGHDKAVRTLRDDHRAVFNNYLRSLDTSPGFVDEVEQNLWAAVLTGSAEAPPKLVSYSGTGPLAVWLGVVAQRIALSLLRHEAAERRARAGSATEVRRASADPELAFVKDHLRGPFQRAILDALATLEDRQRLIYGLHVVDGLTVDRIAQMYGVVRSTVTRWLTSARVAIIDEAKRILRDELSVPPEEFESLARLLASQLDLNVSQVLPRSADPSR
jgi:RNA polymerase sigma-70 factor (ECF subfamily)